jgi:hypothetical protein
MAIGSVIIKNEGLKKFFTHFFGDVVSDAYISKLVDIKDFDADDEKLMAKHNKGINASLASVSDFMELDIGYLIVLTFTSGLSVEINLAAQSCPMNFTKFDIQDALVLNT